MRQLLARCQIAVWAYEDYMSSREALDAAPVGEFMADSFFSLVATLLGLQPIWRSPTQPYWSRSG